MKLFFYFLFALTLQYSFDREKLFNFKQDRNLFSGLTKKHNTSIQRKLNEIESKDITLEYLYKDLVLETINRNELDYKGFSAHKTQNKEIEIFYQAFDKDNKPQGDKILIFEVKMEKIDKKIILLITNTDENKYENFMVTHAQFARVLKEKEEREQLINFLNESFQSMKSLIPKFQNLLQYFISDFLLPYLQRKSYQVKTRNRKYQPHFNTSEILDVFGLDQKKILEILVYNIDQFYLGFQIVFRSSIIEIKIPKKNIEQSFLLNVEKLDQIFPKLLDMPKQEQDQYFGLDFQQKKEIILSLIKNYCSEFTNESKFLLEYPTDAFRVNLLNTDCDLGHSRILVEEINNAYLQYIYIIFDNEFFRSGYMISPQAENFQQSIDDVLRESMNEITHIKHLKDHSYDGQKPTLALIKEQIDLAIKKQNPNIVCEEPKEDSLTCTLENYPITIVKKISLNDVQYYKIQFIKRPKQFQQGYKVLNEMKLPLDNELNLQKRVYDVAQEFYASHKVKIQFNFNYLIQNLFVLLLNATLFLFYFFS